MGSSLIVSTFTIEACSVHKPVKFLDKLGAKRSYTKQEYPRFLSRQIKTAVERECVINNLPLAFNHMYYITSRKHYSSEDTKWHNVCN